MCCVYIGLHLAYQTYQEIQFMTQARQSLIVRGLLPMLADPQHPVSFFFLEFYLVIFHS